MQSAGVIRQLRFNVGMTQNELAEKLSVSRDLVAKWESGKRRPDRRAITKIAEVFNVTPDEIQPRDELLLNELSSCIPDGNILADFNLDKQLDIFLHLLPEKECDIFIRRYHFMQTPAEISSFYGMSESNVRLILHRTRKKLKNHLTEVII